MVYVNDKHSLTAQAIYSQESRDGLRNDLKPLHTFGREKQIKVHGFTNNLQCLQKVMVKDFSLNIIP